MESSIKAGEVADQLKHLMLEIHLSVGGTPREYIRFLRLWVGLYNEKRHKIRGELRHLAAGLAKLISASDTVDELSKKANHQRKELKVAQIAADSAMEQITKALAEATDRRKETEALKSELAENEVETQKRKSKIEGELESIMPILESAQQAVGQIKSENLNEIRSLKVCLMS